MFQNIIREIPLLKDIQYPSPSSSTQLSSNSDAKNEPVIINQGDINEMYFEHKLKYLLKVHEDSSFQNLHILISDFIKDTKLFIQETLKKNKGLKENESTEILEKIEECLNIKNKIEIDSFL